MSRNKISMKFAALGRHLFHSKAGRNLLDLFIGMLYIDAVRKVVFALADNWIQRGSFWRGSGRPGWGRIYSQYQQVAQAVLHSLGRGIGGMTLSPRVARIILHLWGGMMFPTAARQEAVEHFQERHGCKPPWFLVISPTRACNLQCEGCYANAGAGSAPMTGESLAWEVLDRVMTEAKQQWGVRLFVFSGGEPLCYRSQGRDLLDIVEKNKDCLFLMFTNGTLLGEETAERLARLGNLTPALSVEGPEAQTDERRGEGTQRRVLEAMQRLRVAGVPFGISMTVTQANCGQVLADDLLDLYFDREGAFYGFVFQYMPIGRTPNLDWMPAAAQRIPFWERSWQVVRERRLFLLDFFNHGPLVEGCIAAGRERGYLHIDWRGDVMPCVFLPYVAANLHEVYSRGGTLDDAWQTPFLQAIRTWQSRHGYGCSQPSAESNWMLPCPFRDHFGDLRDLVEAMAPQPQAGVAPEGLLEEAFCSWMSAYGREQERLVKPVWEREYPE
jgi:MoaA/NifB/PqqE/SkfB family radical SAM enzyme